MQLTKKKPEEENGVQIQSQGAGAFAGMLGLQNQGPQEVAQVQSFSAPEAQEGPDLKGAAEAGKAIGESKLGKKVGGFFKSMFGKK